MLAGMIVASRKINEGFGIGHGPEIRLKVVEIRGDEVLIGVDGPAGTSIELDSPPPSAAIIYHHGIHGIHGK